MNKKRDSATKGVLNLKESEACLTKAEQAVYEYERDQETKIHISPNVINNCSPHFHNQVEIIAVQTSRQQIQINNQHTILKAGELAIADCFDIHSYTYCDAISTVLIIPDRYLTEYKLYKQERSLSTNFIRDPKIYGFCFPLLEQIAYEKNLLTQKGFINTLLGKILDCTGLVSSKQKSQQDLSLIHSILDYIETHYKEDISLNGIAAYFSYSPSHFSRLFCSFFHYSIGDYINTVRLRKFFELKERNPDSPLLDMIMESGFTSIPTFYRLFTKKIGISPSKYFKQT